MLCNDTQQSGFSVEPTNFGATGGWRIGHSRSRGMGLEPGKPSMEGLLHQRSNAHLRHPKWWLNCLERQAEAMCASASCRSG